MQETCMDLNRGATTKQSDSSSLEDLVKIEDLIEKPCSYLDHAETWEMFADEDYKEFIVNNLLSGYRSTVGLQVSNLIMRVRFSLPAPF